VGGVGVPGIVNWGSHGVRFGNPCEGSRAWRRTGSEDGTRGTRRNLPTEGNRVSGPLPTCGGGLGRGVFVRQKSFRNRGFLPAPPPDPPPQVGREPEKSLSTQPGRRRFAPIRTKLRSVESHAVGCNRLGCHGFGTPTPCLRASAGARGRSTEPVAPEGLPTVPLGCLILNLMRMGRRRFAPPSISGSLKVPRENRGGGSAFGAGRCPTSSGSRRGSGRTPRSPGR
jgi:hypothetical protein